MKNHEDMQKCLKGNPQLLTITLRTEESYVNWIKRFIFFHNKKHPINGREEDWSIYVVKVLDNLKGIHWLVGMLLYGSGLRLTESLELRVKDIDFDYKQKDIHLLLIYWNPVAI